MKCYKSILAVLFALTLSPIAAAHNFGGTGLIADNKTHFVCWNDTGGYPPELSGVLTFFNNYYIVPTQGIWVVNYPCMGTVDVFFDDNLYNPGAMGTWQCTVPDFANGICIEGEARLERTVTSNQANLHGQILADLRWKVWKHELGHSFGLDHETSGSVMVPGPTNLNFFYSSDHIMHMATEITP